MPPKLLKKGGGEGTSGGGAPLVDSSDEDDAHRPPSARRRRRGQRPPRRRASRDADGSLWGTPSRAAARPPTSARAKHVTAPAGGATAPSPKRKRKPDVRPSHRDRQRKPDGRKRSRSRPAAAVHTAVAVPIGAAEYEAAEVLEGAAVENVLHVTAVEVVNDDDDDEGAVPLHRRGAPRSVWRMNGTLTWRPIGRRRPRTRRTRTRRTA